MGYRSGDRRIQDERSCCRYVAVAERSQRRIDRKSVHTRREAHRASTGELHFAIRMHACGLPGQVCTRQGDERGRVASLRVHGNAGDRAGREAWRLDSYIDRRRIDRAAEGATDGHRSRNLGADQRTSLTTERGLGESDDTREIVGFRVDHAAQCASVGQRDTPIDCRRSGSHARDARGDDVFPRGHHKIAFNRDNARRRPRTARRQ